MGNDGEKLIFCRIQISQTSFVFLKRQLKPLSFVKVSRYAMQLYMTRFVVQPQMRYNFGPYSGPIFTGLLNFVGKIGISRNPSGLKVGTTLDDEFICF